MTDMPYSTVSKETMWLLLWSMHQGRGQKVTPSNTPTEEECRIFVAGKHLMMRYTCSGSFTFILKLWNHTDFQTYGRRTFSNNDGLPISIFLSFTAMHLPRALSKSTKSINVHSFTSFHYWLAAITFWSWITLTKPTVGILNSLIIPLITDPDSKLQLADVINLLPTSEVIFLLTALANMAQCRKAEETEFIEAVAFGLFEVVTKWPVILIFFFLKNFCFEFQTF